MTVEHGGGEALEELYWQAEILQALYWMQGEGLATDIAPAALAEFLAAKPDVVAHQMGRLADGGYLEMDATSQPVRYRLTPSGKAEGGRSFQDEFAALTRPAHGECAPGCWCHDPKHAGDPCPSHREVAHAV